MRVIYRRIAVPSARLVLRHAKADRRLFRILMAIERRTQHNDRVAQCNDKAQVRR